MNRCSHSNYIPAGDTVAPNCSGCGTSTIGIVAARRRPLGVVMPDKVLDAAEYNDASISDRLEAAAAMCSLENR